MQGYVSLLPLDAQTLAGAFCMCIFLGGLGYKAATSKNINKLEWSLGIVGALFGFVLLEFFTVGWLKQYLGRYHSWLVGGLIDLICVLMLFMEPKKELTQREKIKERIKLVIGMLCLSWLLFR